MTDISPKNVSVWSGNMSYFIYANTFMSAIQLALVCATFAILIYMTITLRDISEWVGDTQTKIEDQLSLLLGNNSIKTWKANVVDYVDNATENAKAQIAEALKPSKPSHRKPK